MAALKELPTLVFNFQGPRSQLRIIFEVKGTLDSPKALCITPVEHFKDEAAFQTEVCIIHLNEHSAGQLEWLKGADYLHIQSGTSSGLIFNTQSQTFALEYMDIPFR